MGEELGQPHRNGAKLSPQVGITVSEELPMRLTRKAAAEAKRVSEIVREAIENYVRSSNGDPPG